MRALILVLAWMVYMGLGDRVPQMSGAANWGLTIAVFWLGCIDYAEITKDKD